MLENDARVMSLLGVVAALVRHLYNDGFRASRTCRTFGPLSLGNGFSRCTRWCSDDWELCDPIVCSPHV